MMLMNESNIVEMRGELKKESSFILNQSFILKD